MSKQENDWEKDLKDIMPKQVSESKGDHYSRFLDPKKEFELSSIKGMGMSKSTIPVDRMAWCTGLLFQLLRVVIFLLLFYFICTWNMELFELGNFQRIDTMTEKCDMINRFDYSANSWHETLTLNNLKNIEGETSKISLAK
jgi:hypothetical protein